MLLILFMFISFINAWGSQTFSAAPVEAMKFFPGLTDKGIDTLLLYAGVIPLALLMPTSALLVSREGLHRCIQIGAVLVACGLGVRALPAFFSESFRASNTGLCLFFLHLGTILNAAAFPLFMASPSTLSQKWFPPSLRTTITAESSVAAEVGFATAYFTGDLITSPSRLAGALKIEFGIALLACALTLCLLQRIPYEPHSAAAEARNDPNKVVNYSNSLRVMLVEVKAAFSRRAFVVCASAVGLAGGLFTGWAPLLPQFTTPALSEEEADNLGLAV